MTAYELARLTACIMVTIAASMVLVGLSIWIGNLRREALDHRRQAAERDRLDALRAAQWNRFVVWQMRESAKVPRSRVAVRAVDDRVTPIPSAMRSEDLARDEALLSHPEHAPITWRSEDMPCLRVGEGLDNARPGRRG